MAIWFNRVKENAPDGAIAFQIEIQRGTELILLPKDRVLSLPPDEYPPGLPVGRHRVYYYGKDGRLIPMSRAVWIRVEPEIDEEDADETGDEPGEDGADEAAASSEEEAPPARKPKEKPREAPAPPPTGMHAEVEKVKLAIEAEEAELGGNKKRAYTEEITDWHALNRRLRADILHMHKYFMDGHESLSKAYNSVVSLQEKTIHSLAQQLKSLQAPPPPPDYSGTLEATVLAVKDIGVALINRTSDRKQIASDAGLAPKNSLPAAPAGMSNDEIKKFLANLDDRTIAEIMQSPESFKSAIETLAGALKGKQ